MIKVNEQYFDYSINEFKNCNNVLQNDFYALSDVRKALNNMSGLEEESARLLKSMDDIEYISEHLKTMIKVLNFAEMQYHSCENHINANCSSVSSGSRYESRLRRINISSPYYRLLNWR